MSKSNLYAASNQWAVRPVSDLRAIPFVEEADSSDTIVVATRATLRCFGPHRPRGVEPTCFIRRESLWREWLPY
jgi:hypothetical protein